MTRGSADDARLLNRSRLPLVVGALALVTLGALENRAVATVLPTLLGELDAVPSFGLVSAAPLATYLIALAGAGWWCDRSGPVPTLRAGVLAFAAAQLLVGVAPTLGVVVLGRLLSGFAEGLLDVGVIVLIARALDARWRPQMMALFAGAWILPSVLGPVVVGAGDRDAGLALGVPRRGRAARPGLDRAAPGAAAGPARAGGPRTGRGRRPAAGSCCRGRCSPRPRWSSLNLAGEGASVRPGAGRCGGRWWPSWR